ncbi:MAG TPA: hypothetical protein VNU68_02020 [Verrucomicrobiae bacterium]|nr:hypothetical protein [Verrucomicrobiae bacterium]
MAHKHPLYGVWRAMRARCHNPNDHAYPYYGGRGITICPEWSEFKPFFDWAITNGWSPGLFFDRQENDGNYTPSNCRFVLLLQSNRNKSNITITEAQAAEIHVLLDAGIPVREIAQILSVPLTTVENIKRQLCWRKEQLCPM